MEDPIPHSRMVNISSNAFYYFCSPVHIVENALLQKNGDLYRSTYFGATAEDTVSKLIINIIIFMSFGLSQLK
jgi:hypothetical protein